MTEINGGDLQDARLFAGLAVHELEALAHSGVVRTFPENTVIMRRGESSSSLYVILSGRVKVYVTDANGIEQVLGERGSGDHLGEIALLGDSVRTASVATLEDSRFLVLARRPFMQCLARNPQIALHLEESFIARCLTSEVGPAAAERYRAWSTFRRSGMPLILLIGGCAGAGKSTVAAELSLRLDIGRTQSTDLLREVMRLLVPERPGSALHASTYQAWQTVPEGAVQKIRTEQSFIAGFLAQAEQLALAIDGVVSRSAKEGESAIIEGVHLHPAYHQHLDIKNAVILPVLLTVPSRNNLQTHFARRGEQAPSRGSKRYLENLDAILQLQDFFINEAQRCGVAMVQNTRLNETLDRMMALISDFLLRRFARHN